MVSKSVLGFISSPKPDWPLTGLLCNFGPSISWLPGRWVLWPALCPTQRGLAALSMPLYISFSFSLSLALPLSPSLFRGVSSLSLSCALSCPLSLSLFLFLLALSLNILHSCNFSMVPCSSSAKVSPPVEPLAKQVM